MGLSGLSTQTTFQSAPLTEARGDPANRAHRASYTGFQSAPLTEARGDVIPLSDNVSLYSFNPLPSPKQGETPDFSRL